MKILTFPYDDIDAIDPREYIIIKRARVNNLKNVSVAIPRNKLVVITGLSGSGKSSLAFDTLFAEGQRMYVESLSSYARQFLGRMEKPEVDYIRGLSPAIAIEQKVNTRNPRSTVGTTTEIYDYLKLLFARVGTTYSPESGQPVTRDSVSDVVDFIESLGVDQRVMVSCPLPAGNGRTIGEELSVLMSKGFTRLLVEGSPCFIEDYLSNGHSSDEVEILIDRLVTNPGDEDSRFALFDSVQTSYYEGEGTCNLHFGDGKVRQFSEKFEKDGILFEEPTVNFFSFNNPYGACKKCEGFGSVLGIDENLVIPNKKLSVFEGAVAPWRSESMGKWLTPLLKTGALFDFPIHRSYADLSEKERQILWDGNKHFKGIWAFFKHIESKMHKIQYRVLLSRYRGKTDCPDCKGSRLRKDASYVKINDKSIIDLVLMPLEEVLDFFHHIQLSEAQRKISDRLVKEIATRLDYLCKVGLGYLTLNRISSTLSGGEYQRIKLATSLGSALVGSIYVLDEPSIGLHPRDTKRMIDVLQQLRDMGNTVIVVEHEEEIMKAADQIIDIGPMAGSEGGEVVFQGGFEDMEGAQQSLTTEYLSGKRSIEIPVSRRKWFESFTVLNVRANNLKGIDVKIPLGAMTVITGVSGSGKSTLVKKIIHPAFARILGHLHIETTGAYDGLTGDYERINRVEYVDQNPIGRSSRSNPITYIKAFDAIRQLFAEHPMSAQRGYTPSFFSFNVEGGRCEECQGEGTVRIEMQFMADIFLVCESCKGKRFMREILDVEYKGKSVADVLDMTVDEALEFFKDHNVIYSRLKPLRDVGMGYIRLGQSSSTLSGGEAQRVKLASFLSKNMIKETDKILFLFDEPTTGLHMHDIKKLLFAINTLVDQGHTALIIEHNVEVIKTADWIIDLGPDGGEKGGTICFEGTPEEMVGKAGKNHTASFLKPKMGGMKA